LRLRPLPIWFVGLGVWAAAGFAAYFTHPEGILWD
jgi:hypothetical protein